MWDYDWTVIFERMGRCESTEQRFAWSCIFPALPIVRLNVVADWVCTGIEEAFDLVPGQSAIAK